MYKESRAKDPTETRFVSLSLILLFQFSVKKSLITLIINFSSGYNLRINFLETVLMSLLYC